MNGSRRSRRRITVLAGLRDRLRHRWQTGLAVLAIALGVGVVVAIDLAVESARTAFTLSAEAVAGRATHRVTGTAAGLPDSTYRRVRVQAGARPSAPVVEGDVLVGGPGGRPFRLLGVDPLAEAEIRPGLAGAAAVSGERMRGLVARSGRVLLAPDAAVELGLEPGDAFDVLAGGRTATVVLAGTLAADRGTDARAFDGLMIADIATAQELLGRVGRLDAIDLIVPDGAAGERLIERVRRVLPSAAAVAPAGTRARSMDQMIRAFELNLNALGLLALVFGAFLIYNSMMFSVVRRRPIIGRLRALGVTRREIVGLLAAEALAIGLIGSGVGLALGVALGHGLVDLVTRTINDLYFVVAVRDLAIQPAALVRATGLGVGATMLAVILPALEATSTPPRAALQRSMLERRWARGHSSLLGAAAGAVLLGIGLLAWPAGGVGIGFAGLFALLLAGALVAAPFTTTLMRVLRPAARMLLGVRGAMAARGVAATLSRTAPAIAALAIGLAVTGGLGIMIHSFRGSVSEWLDASLAGDVYLSAPGPRTSTTEAPLPDGLGDRVAAVDGVAGVTTRWATTVRSSAGPVRMLALGGSVRGREGFAFEDSLDRVWGAFDNGAILVSEPLAFRHGLGPGDELVLRTDAGDRSFAVAGVFRDYGSDRGLAVIDRAAYDRHWAAAGVSGLAVFAAPGVDVDGLVDRIRTGLAGAGVFIRSRAALRDASLRVFDRTFTVTAVLRLLTLVVALIAVFAALMALQLEREREFAILRATGFTPGQVGGLVTCQTGLIGFAAGLLSIPIAVVLAGVMVFIINRRSFGWGMDLSIDPVILVQAVLLGVVAAVLAGVYPACRIAGTEPAAALREE